MAKVHRVPQCFTPAFGLPAWHGSTKGKNRKKIVKEGVFDLALVTGNNRFGSSIPKSRRI